MVQVVQAQPRGPGGAGRPARNQGALRNGDDAPDFSLRTIDGTQVVTLSEFRGKPVVLVLVVVRVLHLSEAQRRSIHFSIRIVKT